MSLSAGTRLGPYEVTALIGSGGMGTCIAPTTTIISETLAPGGLVG